MTKSQKIVIDARMYGLEHAGIGRYISNLVRELSHQPSAISHQKFILLVRKAKFSEIKKEVGNKFQLVIVDIPHYSFKEQVFLPGILKKIKPDLVHFPHFNVPIFWQGRYIVTIHDLIKHKSRGRRTTTKLTPFYWFKYLAYQIIVFSAVKRAKKIITPSKWWKKELIKRYCLKPGGITVTYEGAGEFLEKKPSLSGQAALKKYGISKPFVIYTGSLYPHKNVLRLAQAIICQNERNEKSEKLSLVIACARNVFLERFKKELEKTRGLDLVVLAGFVPDGELIALYQEAEAFVTPSLLEGFGLPGLEAMAIGLPVISSNASCLPEIYGQAALYFDPLNIEDMTKKIERVIGDKKIRDKLIKKGFEQVKKYSWQKMAKETLQIYDESRPGL